MKAFVITIKDLPQSVEYAQRCIDSAKKFGIDVEMFAAVTPKDDPETIFKALNITDQYMDEVYSRRLNCMSAFLSHYSLWQKCVADDEEYLIFEHDAVMYDKIPDVEYTCAMSIGKPSYGNYQEPQAPGVYPTFSKSGGYLPGAHAYMIKPLAAQWFVYEATKGAKPTDVFLNNKLFPWLQELYPWVAKAEDSFSTIQVEQGCLAKHNYNNNYELLDV